jgi:glycosyltransferase involved in cell wall biosynthesis
MRVAIDARLPDAQWGGVQQVVVGLASGLSRLSLDEASEDEYVFFGYDGVADWLGGHLGGRCRLVEVPRGVGRTLPRRIYDRVKIAAPRVARVLERRELTGDLRRQIPRSDGTIERLRPDVVHFTTQQAFITDVPSIYQPHDLLHLHFPEHFSSLHAKYRDTAYRVFCERASFVTVMTDWGRRDLCARFGLPLDKVAVVPWAPVATLGQEQVSDAALASLGLPPRFLLYPAQTWPHKNHIRLVEAIAVLRERGLRVDVVCTGGVTDHAAAVRRRIDELKIDGQIRFLGFVDRSTLAGLFGRATGLIFPSLFEGFGLPVVEAFAFGTPVACANVTALPEVAGDAALQFDPRDTNAIADAMARLWTDDTLRLTLRARGRARVAELSWDRTARIFHALYRTVCGTALDDIDRRLLAPPTLVAD